MVLKLREISTVFGSYVFWFGDLNFRIDDLPNDEVKRRIEVGDLDYLQPYDQVG